MSTLADQPAFPKSKINDLDDGQDGMTLRQYYAGQAMQGMLANPMYAGEGTKLMVEAFGSNWIYMVAVVHADALIAELSKP